MLPLKADHLGGRAAFHAHHAGAAGVWDLGDFFSLFELVILCIPRAYQNPLFIVFGESEKKQKPSKIGSFTIKTRV